MEYSLFSQTDKKRLLEQRVFALEQDHYGHEIQKMALTAVPDESTTEAIQRSNDAQAIIEAAVAAVKEELQTLELSE